MWIIFLIYQRKKIFQFHIKINEKYPSISKNTLKIQQSYKNMVPS